MAGANTSTTGLREQVLLEERQRENALSEIHWNFIRVDWAQLVRPHEFRGRITEAMARAASRTSALKYHSPAA